MYKLYLFKINDNYDGDNLYKILNEVRESSIKDISTTFSIYRSITSTITLNEKKAICRYLKRNGNYQYENRIHKYYDYYNNEKTYLKFHNNYILIKTNNRNTKVIEYIGKLNNYYLCDFKDKKGLHLPESNLVLE